MLYEYALQRVKGIKKSFDNAMSNAINQYIDNRIVDIYPTTEVFEIYTSIEGMSGAKELSNAETPPVLDLNDGYSVQIEEKRFGGAIELLENEYRREQGDATTKVNTALKRKRNQLLVTNLHLFLTEMFKFLNYAFATTYFAAPDAVALCGTHSWKTSGASTFSNAGTSAFSESAVDDVVEIGADFQDASGRPMVVNFDTIIVKKGSPNAREAKKLFAMGISPIAVGDINIYEGEFTIIETPYITATNKAYWFMRDSKDLNGNPLKIGIGEYPTLREPIKQNNEAIRSNCTGFWKQGIINMPYSWYGSTGAA
ncbi:MAG: hypothetical protein V1779_17710 [bacterium]